VEGRKEKAISKITRSTLRKILFLLHLKNKDTGKEKKRRDVGKSLKRKLFPINDEEENLMLIKYVLRELNK
jgi:hypothetical protein